MPQNNTFIKITLFFKKTVWKLGEKGNNFVQENIERKHFKLFYKVRLDFVCTFCTT